MIIFGTNVEADFSAFVPLNRCLFCLKERLMMLHIRDFLCIDVHWTQLVGPRGEYSTAAGRKGSMTLMLPTVAARTETPI